MNRPTFGERIQEVQRRRLRPRKPRIGVLVALTAVLLGAGLAALQVGDGEELAATIVYAIWISWSVVIVARVAAEVAP